MPPADLPLAELPLIDATSIKRLVGQGAYQRAVAYAKSGAVRVLNWHAGTGRLSAVVEGNNPHPYNCSIDIQLSEHGMGTPGRSVCSCPVSFDCKHVAAALLECNARHVREAMSAPAHVVPGPEPEWKRILGGAATASEAAGTPLALQFEVRPAALRRHSRWQPGGGPESNRTRLSVRPMMRGKTGRWIKGNLSWGTLQHHVHRLELDPRQVQWFGELWALDRSGSRVYLGQDQEYLTLDDYPSPLLWHLLREGERLGIEFVNDSTHGVVTLGERASLRLDAVATATATAVDARAHAHAASGLTLQTTVEFDGTVVDASSVAAIGNHGLYTVSRRQQRGAPLVTVITLAPTAGPLTAEQRRLLRHPQLAVPEGDVDEFLASYYPVLSRAVTVTSTDGSVRLPDVSPPVLVLDAAHEPEGTLRLEWWWEYGVGDRAVRAAPGSPADVIEPGGAPRDVATERETLALANAALENLPLESIHVVADEAVVLRDVDAAEYAVHALPALADVPGVRVDVAGEQPGYRELTEAPELTMTTVETDDRDWFDLGVIVTVEGRDVPFGPLFSALSTGRRKLKLVDHSYLSLDQPVFARLKDLIDEARDLAEWETGPRINRYQASLWAEFEDLADQTVEAQQWRAAVGGLLALAESDEAPSLESPLPAGLNATLRPYQVQGFSWLAFLWRHGLGGILADDMGLGKTLQTLALIAHAREAESRGPGEKPFLVVAPTSVVSNWASEAARFTPGLAVTAITETENKSGVSLAERAAASDIVITSYALFRLDFAAYQAWEWSGLILDEAQFVKNPASKAHECARDLRAPFTLAVTGTPMENNLMELWSLLAIVAPGLFPSSRIFTEQYVRPVQHAKSRGDNDQVLARLRRRIRPLILRRTKEIVAPELPAKQEQVLAVELAPAHRRLYDTFLQRERQKLLGLLEDLDRNRFIVFRSLTLLRMLSLDASLIDEKYAAVPSSKLDALFEQLDDVLAEGHKPLIFSQFTTYLKKVADRLHDRGIEFAYLDGSTRRRSDAIDAFRSGPAQAFLISLKAGGFGLNLTEADYVFLLDPWWNPATEAQAVDRTHRIGQEKNVMVYRMVALDTIEEKVMALKEEKARLFDAVLDDDATFGSALTADDIRGLLEG